MLGVTWWGHSFVTVTIGGIAVATDPLMARRLFHLRRASAPPPSEATRCDVVLISHLHHDHLHLPSLRRFDDDIPIVVPRGAVAAVKPLKRLVTIEVEPGDRIEVAGVDIEVLSARHDGSRLKSAGHTPTRAMGFRFEAGGQSCWYPGDTGPMDFSPIDAVDLALMPIGGWGPSLGDHHVDPVQAVDAIADVGARWVLPVHYGTFWPIVLPTGTRSHAHWFGTPATRFREAADAARLDAEIVIPELGERVTLR